MTIEERAEEKDFNLFYSLLRKHGIFEYDARMFPLVKEYAAQSDARIKELEQAMKAIKLTWPLSETATEVINKTLNK